ncbi:MAG: hypothetical protein ACI4T5_08095 [Prevotella sp.]
MTSRSSSFSLVTYLDNDHILNPNLVQCVAELFKTVKPFNDYINWAVDFTED